MAGEKSVEELQKQLTEANAKIAELNNQNQELQTENDELATKVSSLVRDVDTLRKGLNLAKVEEMAPEVKKLIAEKMAAGLPENQAIECAFKQLAHNKNLADAKKKASATQQPAKPAKT